MNNPQEPAAVIDRVAAWLEAADPPPWIVETSGSTGRPKRVRLPRSAVLASARASAARVGGTGEWLLALPAGYVAGLNVIVRSLVAGHRPRLPGEGFEGIDGGFVSLVPTQLHRLLDEAPDELRRFHTVLLGGGPIDPDLRNRASEAGVRVVATYGSAETCGGCVYDGLPLDGVALAIGGDGRVRIGGPTLFDGYDGDPDLTRQVLQDGWFLTSDAGRLGEDGRLRLLGRIDDMVVTGGVNVPAPAVAARLREHPDVEQAEVLGVPDEEWGNRVVAFIVRRVGRSWPETSADSAEDSGQVLPTRRGLDEVRDWVGERHPRSWAPRQLVVLDDIPLLPNGKTDRMRLRDMA